jgi:hypothetical protein
MEATIPKQICGYPLPGWRLGYVQYDQNREGQPDGWIVKLVREHLNWAADQRESNVMARSDIGPLEAWDEAICIAMRCDARAAERAATKAAAASAGASS